MKKPGPKPHPDQWDLPLPPPQYEQLWTWARLIRAFTETYLVDKARNTNRSYRSTFRAVVAEFGANTLPSKSALYGWLAGKVKRGELMPGSANTMRGHLHQLFSVVRDDHDAHVLNAASFPPFDVGNQRPEGLKDPEGTWEKLKRAMPDCRVVLYLAFQFFLGLRKSEVLGLEWKHVKWNSKHGPEIYVEQQRDAALNTPAPHLKHKAPKTWYPLEDPEVVKLLRQVSQATMKGGLFGCRRGKLVGTTECKDGEVRRYIFPYWKEHVEQISRWVEEAAPEEFPKGIKGVKAAKKFHRFRHTFCTEVVRDLSGSAEGMKLAQGLMRHKNGGTTERYSKGALGEGANRDALRMVREARQARQQEQREGVPVLAISSGGKPNSHKRKPRP